jgi:hypothetical protein
MTARELILSNIQLEGESNQAYFRRLASESDSTFDALKMQYYKLKRKFIITQQKKDKNGNVTSTTEKESQNKALFELNKETIRESVKELDLKPLNVAKIAEISDKILLITYTDVHVGMNIENDLYDRFNNHSKIVVQDLGDFVDGYNGETTRGGHALPQNMSNTECFKIASKFKIELAKKLAIHGVPLEFHSVVNDNHGGDFGNLVNIHAKEVLSYLLPEAKYNISEDFISHYIKFHHSTY